MCWFLYDDSVFLSNFNAIVGILVGGRFVEFGHLQVYVLTHGAAHVGVCLESVVCRPVVISSTASLLVEDDDIFVEPTDEVYSFVETSVIRLVVVWILSVIDKICKYNVKM